MAEFRYPDSKTTRPLVAVDPNTGKFLANIRNNAYQLGSAQPMLWDFIACPDLKSRRGTLECKAV